MVACGSAVAPTGASFDFQGFSDHVGTDLRTPTDVTPGGGTLNLCDPQHIYAFIQVTSLSAWTDMTYVWWFDNQQASAGALAEDRPTSLLRFRFPSEAGKYRPGVYAFRLYSGGYLGQRVEAEGSFRLVCQ
jgi:hypothetical protein